MLNSVEERLDILAPTGSVVAQVTVSDSEARLKTDDQETVGRMQIYCSAKSWVLPFQLVRSGFG